VAWGMTHILPIPPRADKQARCPFRVVTRPDRLSGAFVR